jgi:2-iminobutanoate/2-iminopropanoate deaminase
MAKLVRTFNTIKGPKAIGPYSTVTVYQGLMFVSGQIGINPQSMELESEDVEGQTRRALDNMSLLF